MSELLDRGRALASRMLKREKQGVIDYIHTPLTGTIYNPTKGTPVSYPLDAVAKGVEFQYIKEGYISASDVQVTSAVFDVKPTQSGKVSIDGREKQIIAVQQIPAAGVPVAWVIFCKS